MTMQEVLEVAMLFEKVLATFLPLSDMTRTRFSHWVRLGIAGVCGNLRL